MKIEPHKQFPHTPELVAELAEMYGIDVWDYCEAKDGIENTTLIVNGSLSKHVFRISRRGKKSTASIQAELDFMEYLHAHGIPVPQILPNNHNQLITEFQASGHNWQIIVMDHVRGEHVVKPTLKVLCDLATTQARMHTLAASYTDNTTNVRRIHVLEEREFIPLIEQASLSHELQMFLQRGAGYSFSLDDLTNVPTGLCHLDYDEQNILIYKDSISAVLDFDDLSIVPYAVCLAYTLWHVYDQSGVEALSTYLSAYEQLRPLSQEERRVIYPAMLYRHYMISAIKVLYEHSGANSTKSYIRMEKYILAMM